MTAPARLLCLLAALGLGSAAQAQAVFINEIHYDNAGTDAGEAIEIAGPAGTNLAGWDLVLYNGSNGTVYSTTEVGAVIPNEGDGAGTVVVNYPSNGIQNGSPDGVALVTDQGVVVQFLSYEGTLTAVGGPADGMTSQDIGVSEGSSTPLGESLQLTGIGSDYADFTWAGPTGASFGEVNSGQTLVVAGDGGGDPAAPRLVVNEVDYDQAGVDAAEYVELYNGGTATADLGGFELVLVNGSNDQVYKTIALPATPLAPGEFFVVCANAETVANCDLDVDPNTNLVQNGAPDAVALRTVGGVLVDALSYEGAVPGFTEGEQGAGADDGTVDFAGLSRLPDGADTDDNAADFALRCGSPGAANAEDAMDCPSTAPGVVAITPIHDVQGSGAATPLDGREVMVRAVVVGDVQPGDGDDADLGGFFLQEEDGDADNDDSTSEGLFVFTGNASVPVPDVAVGDVVTVTGTAGEFSGGTQLSRVSAVAVTGTAPLPAPVSVTLPLESATFLERYEGMRAALTQPLVIAESFNFDRFGEVVLALPRDGRDRLYQPTAYLDPSEAAAVEAENELRKVVLDDARGVQNADAPRHPNGRPFTLDNRFRGGDVVEGAVGVLDDRFGAYRLQPTAPADYTAANPRQDRPDAVGGVVQVASFNVLNYFNGDGQGGGFPTSRGADDAEEFERQTAKVVAAIRGLGASVVGVIEIENDPDGELSAIDDLVDALNAAEGAEVYDYVRTGVTGGDAIKNGLLYRPAAVTPVGDPAVLDADAFVAPFGRPGNRPALAQTFADGDGATFTVVVNHLKSKGSACGPGDDDPVQGNCNGTRTAAAEALVEWLATDPTGSSDPDVLVIGDLNAYDKEDPIAALREGGLVDLVDAFEGEFAYSYVFDGEVGYLDYALASASLADQVTGATTWHINADEPDLLDYDTQFNDPAFFEPNPFRASDHDPILVGLALEAGDGTAALGCSAAPLSFDADGSGRPVTAADFSSVTGGAFGDASGEFAGVRNEGDRPVDLSSCSFVVFDPFSEVVTYAAVTDGTVAGASTYVLATEGGDQGLPAQTLPDSPGAFALVTGTAAEGDRLDGDLLGRVVAAVVYDRNRDVFGSRGSRPSQAELDAFGEAFAAIFGGQATPTEGGAGVDLSVAAWPNPTAGAATVAFGLAEGGAAHVAVYDVLGREVAVLADGPLARGRHAVAVGSGALPAGAYVVRVTTAAGVQTTRLTVAR